jgi:hypothetical protein
MMIAPVGRRYHSKEGLEEIKSVFLAELDYAREADTADVFPQDSRGDDAIVVPRVHHSLTTRRVLTCELIGGVDYATFCEQASQAEKNAAGQTIWRFMFMALFQYGLLYADPHPGNYRFLGGERVAFLDFGCAKKLPPDLVSGMKRYVNAAADDDWDEFYRACAEVLGYDPKDPDGWRLYTEYTKYIIRPLTLDALYKYSHESARENIAFLVRNGKKLIFRPDDKLPNLPMPIHLPHDMTFVSRLQWGLAQRDGRSRSRGELAPDHGPVAALPSRTTAGLTRSGVARVSFVDPVRRRRREPQPPVRGGQRRRARSDARRSTRGAFAASISTRPSTRADSSTSTTTRGSRD